MLKLTYFLAPYCATEAADWVPKAAPAPSGAQAQLRGLTLIPLSRSFSSSPNTVPKKRSQQEPAFFLPPGRTH